MYNISPELQVRVEVLKDMLMYRVDKRQCIRTNDELSFALFALSRLYRLICSVVIALYFLLFLLSLYVCMCVVPRVRFLPRCM